MPHYIINHNPLSSTFNVEERTNNKSKTVPVKNHFIPFSFFLIIIILLITAVTGQSHHHQHNQQGISKQILENWASKFGGPLFEFGKSVTKYNELQGRFQHPTPSPTSTPLVTKIELDKLIVEMTNEVNTMLREKLEAIRKIMLFAEQKALEHQNSDLNKPRPLPQTYYNAKKLNNNNNYKPHDLYHVVDLKWNEHFREYVNTSFSTIHVPTSIYEKKTGLLEAIGWTSQMDATFESNYLTNPTLGFQYFGSKEGFLRQYPGAKWANQNGVKANPDLYDCRTRQWYVSAATSPKNMIILQDVSGSMTGLRREIAKHVVSTILDTLTENDFVNVYSFAEETRPVVPCFGGRLVQANLENIRDLKDGLEVEHTTGVANFNASLNKAFDILEKHLPHNNPGHVSSSGCNQAIMIITDGSPYNYEEIFRQRQNREHSARIFTYLIGRDVMDNKREVMYMACANSGYYTHVSTLSEVQEQVLKYIPVMARPLVMHGNHTVAWTNVYADVADPHYSTDWSWGRRNSRRQYQRVSRYKLFLKNNFSDMFIANTEEDEIKLVENIKRFLDDAPSDFLDSNEAPPSKKKSKPPPFNFIVTASIPVFDVRNVSREGTPLASLLGVAGTDIPLRELQKIASPFKLGVGGYSFITNNNGYIIYHPDHRPIFRGELLKPNYNSVDIAEVELYDGPDGAGSGVVRNNHSSLLEFRQDLIELDRGYKTMGVRGHQEGFRRLSLRTQKYEFSKLSKVIPTPYTLTISAPASLNSYHGQMELYLEKDHGLDLTAFFGESNEPRRWSVNPEWSYCEYVRTAAGNGGNGGGGGGGESVVGMDKEDELLHFLRRIEKAKKGWKWKNTGVGIKQRHQNKGNKVLDGDIYECDRDLVQSLVFDANVTEVFTEKKLWKINREDKKLIHLNGATSTFLATRSGLTRWINFEDSNKTSHFTPSPRATSEVWYQRAVDRYLIDPDSFVFSVPFDAGGKNGTRVMATRAVFVTNQKNGLQAPVAVVGVEFKHEEWAGRFFDITSTCVESSSSGGKMGQSNYVDSNCKKTCESGEYDCYVLDDNGFVLISERKEETGLFFGQIDAMVMEMLVNSDVYKRVKVTDHQAVCFQPVQRASSSTTNNSVTPLTVLASILSLLWNAVTALANSFSLMTLQVLLNLPTTILADYEYVNDDNFQIIDEGGINSDVISGGGLSGDTLHPFLELASINKTRLRPCDKETFLYTYGGSYNSYNFSYHGLLTKCGHQSGCNGYFNVHFIPHTNLILVVTDGKCRCGGGGVVTQSGVWGMKEVEYPSVKVPNSYGKSSSSGNKGGNSGGDEEDIPPLECNEGMLARLGMFRALPSERGCVRYNANEQNMDCGRATTTTTASSSWVLLLLVTAAIVNY